MRRLLLAVGCVLVLAPSAWAQAAGSVSLLQRIAINPGTYQSPGVPLNTEAREVFLAIDVTEAEWASEPLLWLSLELQLSRDAGVTWTHWVAATAQGGEVLRPGSPMGVGVQLRPEDYGCACRVRAILSVNRRVRVGARFDWTGQ